MASFDDLATTYDLGFSHASIGAGLRRRVWQLWEMLDISQRLDILEINCGTGEDALFFAGKGHKVTATDASAAMIDVAEQKDVGKLVDFRTIAFADLKAELLPAAYDVVWSDFGGLNCIDTPSLQGVLQDVHSLLRPGGVFIGVIMGSRCLWETVYYLLKGKRTSAFRRYKKTGVATVIGSQIFTTYYHSPSVVKRISEGFFIKKIIPVGLFMPPTYLEHYFKKHPKRLAFLERLEQKTNRLSLLANLSDHYMIILEKRR